MKEYFEIEPWQVTYLLTKYPEQTLEELAARYGEPCAPYGEPQEMMFEALQKFQAEGLVIQLPNKSWAVPWTTRNRLVFLMDHMVDDAGNLHCESFEG
jgi:hypothetical protein